MISATADLPLATTVTGSLPRPGWCDCRLDGKPLSLGLADKRYREQYFDMLATYVVDQHRAGLDILVDGDARLDDGFAGRHWFAYVEERLEGMGPAAPRAYPVHRDKPLGGIMHEVMATRLPRTVTGPVGGGRLDYVQAWKAIQQLTDKPVKLGGISGQLVEASINNEFYDDRRDLVMALSDRLNTEYHALADAGCPIVQIEEPCIHGIAGTTPGTLLDAEFYVEALNREVRGLRDKSEVWCHTCWGNPLAQRTRERAYGYDAALPYLDRLDVDVLTFEGRETGGADFAAIGRQIGEDKKIAIGVVSHRTLQVEPPEEVAALVRKALEHIEPERLILSSDCGFGRQGMSRTHAFYKMVSIVLGANIVRRELGLPEAEVRAADPRFAMIED